MSSWLRSAVHSYPECHSCSALFGADDIPGRQGPPSDDHRYCIELLTNPVTRVGHNCLVNEGFMQKRACRGFAHLRTYRLSEVGSSLDAEVHSGLAIS